MIDLTRDEYERVFRFAKSVRTRYHSADDLRAEALVVMALCEKCVGHIEVPHAQVSRRAPVVGVFKRPASQNGRKFQQGKPRTRVQPSLVKLPGE